jgi:hypothetical protein
LEVGVIGGGDVAMDCARTAARRGTAWPSAGTRPRTAAQNGSATAAAPANAYEVAPVVAVAPVANAVAPADAVPYASLPNTFPKSANAIYLACLEEKNYQLIKEILHEICSQQLDFYARLKNLDISGEDMLQFITADADPYQWNKSINQFMH